MPTRNEPRAQNTESSDRADTAFFIYLFIFFSFFRMLRVRSLSYCGTTATTRRNNATSGIYFNTIYLNLSRYTDTVDGTI